MCSESFKWYQFMLTKLEADQLLDSAKEAARTEVLKWHLNSRNDEIVVSISERDVQFILSINRSPYELRAHFRTKGTNIALARIDSCEQHFNPDGSCIRGPHLHWYKEGYDNVPWAEEIDWYDSDKPVETLYKFLELIKTKFPKGIQDSLL